MHAHLHRRGDGLRAGDAERPGHVEPHDEADRAEERRDQADVGEVVADVLALVEQDAEHEDGQDHRRADPHRLVHASGEVRRPVVDHHPDADGQQDQGEDLDDLDQRHRHVVLAVVERDGQAGDQRQGDDRDHRVDRRQGDVERDVAAEEVAEEVGGRAARRRGEQQHADPQQGGQVEEHDQPEADGRQQDDLARQRDGHGPRCAPDPLEVGDRQVEAEAEHDDRQRERQPDGGQCGVHARTLVVTGRHTGGTRGGTVVRSERFELSLATT